MIKHRNHRGEQVLDERTRRMVFSTGAVQYDAGGKWQDIDTTLLSIGANYWFMDKAPYGCYVGKRADMGLRFENGEHGFSWLPQCRPVAGQLKSGNVALYENAFGDGVHLQIGAGNNNLTKLIIIEKKPATIPDYIDFRFKMPTHNLTAMHNDMRELDLGELTWVRSLMKLLENSESASYIWKAMVWGRCGRSAQINLGFEMVGGDCYMIKRIPRKVLEQFSYPIKTDASSSFIAGTGDGNVNCSLASWALSHDATTGEVASYTHFNFTVGIVPYYNKIQRGYLPFDTTGLPASAQLTSAELILARYGGTDTAPTLRLTECFQASTSELVVGDYEDNGYSEGNEHGGHAKDTPIVAGSTDMPATWCWFSLNSAGLNWVKTDGSTWTKLGLRHVNDCTNVPPSQASYVHYNSSNDTDSANHPRLSVVYQTDYTAPEGDGGLGWGGAATIAREICFAGSGGFGAGGLARVCLPVLYDTANAVSFAAAIKTVASVSCDNNPFIDYSANATTDYKRPYLLWRSADTDQTTITLTFAEPIDTLLLYNCNFETFNISVTASTEFATIQDTNTGFYNGIVRLNQNPGGSYAAKTNSLQIIIPSQTPTDGKSRFSIGSIVGAVRKQLTEKPQYPFAKEFVEPMRRLDYDGGAWDVESSGNPYHIIEYNWNAISEANFAELQAVVREIDIVGACIVHEKWDDYEVVYLCTMMGDFDYSLDNLDRISSRITFRELN